MLRHRTIKLAATAAMAIMACMADADGHLVGNAFFSNRDPGGNAFAFLTLDGSTKSAGLIADIHHLDPKQPKDRLVVGFIGKGDWDKFLSVWNDAVHAKPPSEAEAYKIDTNRPSYFDGDTMVSLSKDTDGDIDFSFVGKPDADKHPSVIGSIRLLPADFKDFDADLNAISSYFSAK